MKTNISRFGNVVVTVNVDHMVKFEATYFKNEKVLSITAYPSVRFADKAHVVYYPIIVDGIEGDLDSCLVEFYNKIKNSSVTVDTDLRNLTYNGDKNVASWADTCNGSTDFNILIKTGSGLLSVVTIDYDISADCNGTNFVKYLTSECESGLAHVS